MRWRRGRRTRRLRRTRTHRGPSSGRWSSCAYLQGVLNCSRVLPPHGLVGGAELRIVRVRSERVAGVPTRFFQLDKFGGDVRLSAFSQIPLAVLPPCGLNLGVCGPEVLPGTTVRALAAKVDAGLFEDHVGDRLPTTRSWRGGEGDNGPGCGPLDATDGVVLPGADVHPSGLDSAVDRGGHVRRCDAGDVHDRRRQSWWRLPRTCIRSPRRWT